jgi:nucleoside-diphosphate-sugar epimerase
MKVLLTGASGFVGSHILDSLRARGLETVVLLRATSNTRFILPHLPDLEVRLGSITDPASLRASLADITHVIHCAGATRALRTAHFTEANQVGTRNVVEAIAGAGHCVERLVHLSSLAAVGPALPERPADEEQTPAPVSDYGRSKLAGEQAVAQGCRVPFVILRPPAVYGPRDGEFLRLFKAVKAHLSIHLMGGPRALSLVYARDLAGAVLAALTHPQAPGRTYHVASPDWVAPGRLADEMAAQLGVRTVALPLPVAFLWPVCLFQDGWSRLTRKPSLLGLQKYPEIRAPGWVCNASRLRRELGYVCSTRLDQGIAETLAWYRQEGWLKSW